MENLQSILIPENKLLNNLKLKKSKIKEGKRDIFRIEQYEILLKLLDFTDAAGIELNEDQCGGHREE